MPRLLEFYLVGLKALVEAKTSKKVYTHMCERTTPKTWGSPAVQRISEGWLKMRGKGMVIFPDPCRQDHQRTGASKRKTPFDGGQAGHSCGQGWQSFFFGCALTMAPRLIYRESLRNPKERLGMSCNDHVALDQWVNYVLSRPMMAHHEAKTPHPLCAGCSSGTFDAQRSSIFAGFRPSKIYSQVRWWKMEDC